jgi:DNA polymerase III subunit delta'
MTFPIYFDPKKSLNLFGLFDKFDFLKNLYLRKKLPKVLMLSGKKGDGKSTLINHLMFYIFDEQNYNINNYTYKANPVFHNQFLNNIYSNIIYLSGSDFKNIKIDDIRKLKTKIFQTLISNKPRFIILDDVELFNNSSLNALLKIIEEPSKNNYFFLINNQSKPLLETIKSRCINIKIILNEKSKQEITESLIKKYAIQLTIDPKCSQLTPGNFIKFNHILDENSISIDKDFLKNLETLLNLHKKDKNIFFIDLIFFLTDKYFNNLRAKNIFSNQKIVEYKKYVLNSVNKYIVYNLNPNNLLNNINNKIND